MTLNQKTEDEKIRALADALGLTADTTVDDLVNAICRKTDHAAKAAADAHSFVKLAGRMIVLMADAGATCIGDVADERLGLVS